MTHDDDDRPRPNALTQVRPRPLLAVFVGGGALAASMVCLYLVMRTVGLDYGGACASGGPYEIRPGQECQSGDFVLAFVGIIGIMISALLLLWGSSRYGGQLVVTSASGVLVSGFFGGLGGSFASIATELPASSDAASEFQFVGIMFIVFAVVGLPIIFGPPVYALRTQRLDIVRPALRVWLAWFATVVVAGALGVALTALIAG